MNTKFLKRLVPKTKILFNVMLIFVLVASALVPIFNNSDIYATDPNTTIFTDNFESGLSAWTLNGTYNTSITQSVSPTHSLKVDSVGNVSKKLSVEGIDSINSPNRNITFQWYSNSPNWWDNDWLKRYKITFDNTASTENLINFPVLITLSTGISGFDYADCQADLGDLRFIDTDGTTVLKYEIDTLNVLGESYVWVKIPQLDNNKTDYIYMYYDNSVASNGWDVAGTWNSDYVAVYHMNDLTTSTISDSTGINNGTKQAANNPQVVAGAIGNAQSFNGTSSFINLGTDASLDNPYPITIEMNVNEPFNASSQRIITSPLTFTNTFFICTNQVSSANKFQWGYGNNIAADTKYSSQSATINTNTTMSFVIQTDMSTATVYKNGVISTIENGSGNTIVNGNVTLGAKASEDGSYFKGILDEVRISKVARSYSWLRASYMTEFNSTFATFNNYESIFSLEEGYITDTNKTIEMFWDGANIYFNLYRYADDIVSSTTTSSVMVVSVDNWHEITITSSTLLTEIKIDGNAVQFGGLDSSDILTNVWNWVRYSAISVIPYYIDDVVIKKENISNTANLYSDTFSAISGTVPAGNDKIYAIYEYLLNRDVTALNNAKTGASSIQTSFSGGTKNLFYVKELAILAYFDSSYITLLNNLTSNLWAYGVNATTKLSYQTVNAAGVATDTSCRIGDPPDVLSVVVSFMYAYKITNNSTYLSHAEDILTAVNTYMLSGVYNTAIWQVSALDGTVIDSKTRTGDEIANYIECLLFMYDNTGINTYLTRAIYQADQCIINSWDNTNNLFVYRPDERGFEAYVPSMSLALTHLYKITNTADYLIKSEQNYNTYLTELKRNGNLLHYILDNGLYGHEAAIWIYDIPIIASELYKITNDVSYLNISDEYMSIILGYYEPIDADHIYSDSFTLYSGLTYLEREQAISIALNRSVLESNTILIHSYFSQIPYTRYQGTITNSPNMWFTNNAVNLLDVSGNGVIKFSLGINTVNITTSYGTGAFDVTTSHQVDLEVPTVTTQAATGIIMSAAGVTGGSFNGNLIYYDGDSNGTSLSFEYGLTNLYGSTTSSIIKTSTGAYLINIPNNLIPGATYHFRSKAQNITGTSYGNDQTVTFTMPTVVDVVGVTQSGFTATLTGNVTNMGVATSTNAYFQWGYDGVTYPNNSSSLVKLIAGQYSATINGYNPALTIYYRSAVSNGSTIVTGAGLSFTPSGTTVTSNNLLSSVLLIVFFCLGLILLIGVAFKDGGNLMMTLIIAAVLIYMLIAFTQGININLNALWGG